MWIFIRPRMALTRHGMGPWLSLVVSILRMLTRLTYYRFAYYRRISWALRLMFTSIDFRVRSSEL